MSVRALPYAPHHAPHLLIVDDDLAVRQLMQDALAEMGYRSTAASSLDQALRLIDQEPYDLILADCFSSTTQDALASVLPVRELSFPTPVVICTAWPLTAPAVKEQGFAGLVAKPFTLDDLVTRVAECLDQPVTDEKQLRQLEIARRYVDAVSHLELGILLDLVTSDVIYHPWPVAAYPGAHAWRGRAAGRAYFLEVGSYFSDWRVDPVHFYLCPRGVAARVLVQARTPDGTLRRQAMGICFQFTDDGKIRQVGLPLSDEHLRELLEAAPER